MACYSLLQAQRIPWEGRNANSAHDEGEGVPQKGGRKPRCKASKHERDEAVNGQGERARCRAGEGEFDSGEPK